MRFRTATPHDAELILRFWQESCASMAATDHVEHVRRVVSYPGTVLLLAVAEDEIIGTLLGAFDGWRGNLYRLIATITSSCGNARRLRGTATRVKDGPQHSISVVTGGFGEEPR